MFENAVRSANTSLATLDLMRQNLQKALGKGSKNRDMG
jgi:hypothetical protein